MKSHRTAILTMAVLLLSGAALPRVRAQEQAPEKPKEEEPPPAAPAEEKAFDPKGSDAEAIALVDRLWKAMGGKPAYDGIDFIRFSLRVERGEKTVATRDLLWDRRAGRLRVHLETVRGDLVILMNLETEAGVAFENGKPVPEEDVPGVVRYAHDNFWVRDCYRLVGPWKFKDKGVHLRMQDDVERDGKKLRQIKVTFDADADMPRTDVYFVLLDPDTGLIREWSWRIQGMKEEDPPVAFVWKDWVELSGVRFSPVREQRDGDQKILFQDLSTPSTVEPDAFEGL